MRLGSAFHHHGAVFSLRDYGSFPWSYAGNGALRSTDDPFRDWNGRNENRMGLSVISAPQIPVFSVYFLSGVLDSYDHHASSLLLFCAETVQNGDAYSWRRVRERADTKTDT